MIPLAEKIEATLRAIGARGEDGVWLSRFSREALLARAAEVAADPRDLPLRGQTFAVKDNVDVLGLPTTAACPEFSTEPAANATVVQRLLDAGAIVIGKTNLDQFATGLNGTRTPHPIPRNSIHPDYIPGGSSSGSAVAVATGLVDFALGTDTAGSGRIPAAFNNLVGLKPTKGRWSTTGLVPACRSLDCITVLAPTLAAATRVDHVARGFDPTDPYSRPPAEPIRPVRNRVAVLAAPQREFFGDTDSARLYAAAIERTRSLGFEITEFGYAPFLDAAALLYDGPWIAERLAAIQPFLDAHADAIHPVVRQLVEGGTRFSAVDTFRAHYRLAELTRATETLWDDCDSMLLPTAGTIYTVDQMLADPIRLNSNLGRYTNFVNLLDLCALAVPAGFRPDGLPFGVTFIGPAWTEARQTEIAAAFLGENFEPPPAGAISLAVVGAHLRGEPLHHQLLDLGARFVAATRTTPNYRLHALPGTSPEKPGLVRVAENGTAIEVEVYSLTPAAFGTFVAAVPPPLTIGTVTLDSGESVNGFLCEPLALRDAPDVSEHGGWRGYLASRNL
jgi:allophanate hydrolase